MLQGTSLPPPGPQQPSVVPSSLPYAVLMCSNKGKVIPGQSIILEQAEQTGKADEDSRKPAALFIAEPYNSAHCSGFAKAILQRQRNCFLSACVFSQAEEVDDQPTEP